MSKNKIYLILSFILPIIFYSLFFLICSFKILYSDLYAQYLPVYKYVYNVLHGNATFPYTFSKGLGGSMYGAFFYGFSNFFIPLLYFFKNIKLFIIILILIKIGLSGLTCYILLRYNKYNYKNCLIFSLAYAFSGYICLYFIHVIWLDALWLLPLLIIGIDKVIYENKDFFYIITLLYSLICNYYIGYMMVAFSIIYYFYKIILIENNHLKKNLKQILHFLLITFFIGGCIMFILIPVYYESLNFNRYIDNNIFSFRYTDYLSGTFIGYEKIDNILNEYTMLTYCGTLCLILNYFYFLSSKISRKEKILMSIIYFIIFIPIYLKPFDKIWHLFTFPMFFSYRYSFIFILLKIMNSIKIFENENTYNYKLKYILAYYIIFSLPFIAILNSKNNIHSYSIHYTNIIITILFILFNIIMLYKNKKNILIFSFIIELILNLSVTCYSFFKLDLNNDIYEKQAMIISNYTENNYRAEVSEIFYNNSLSFNYHGISTFLSNQNYNNILFGNKLNNYYDKTNLFVYSDINIFYDVLVGLKYIVDDNKVCNYDILKNFEFQNKNLYLHKNEYALNLGYSVSKDVTKFKLERNDSYKFYNKLFNTLDGTNDDYFIKLNVNKVDSKKLFIKKSKKYSPLYILSDNIPNNIDQLNIKFFQNYYVVYDQCTDNIVFEFDDDVDNFEVYTINIEKIKKFVSSREQFIIEENRGNYIYGNINLSKDSSVLFSIPYEDGWTIYVDGNKVKYYKFLESFIGINLNKGSHSIKMYYEIPGIKIGIIISLISLISLISYELRKKII